VVKDGSLLVADNGKLSNAHSTQQEGVTTEQEGVLTMGEIP